MAAYRRAGIVVTSSVKAGSGDQDGLPVALLEAMASGCAVAAPRFPGIDEAVVDGESGLPVDPGDEAALTAAISKLAGDPHLRRSMGKRAAEAAVRLSVDRVGERYTALLERTAGP